jgi:hypothetical protein
MSHSSNLLRSPRARRYRRRHPSKLQRPPAMQQTSSLVRRSSSDRAPNPRRSPFSRRGPVGCGRYKYGVDADCASLVSESQRGRLGGDRRRPTGAWAGRSIQPTRRLQFNARPDLPRCGSGRRSGGAMRCHGDRQHSDHSVFDGVPEQTVRNVVEQERVMDSASTRTASSRHFHLQRLAPAGPQHRPLAHWLFHVHGAPERRLCVVCRGWPRYHEWRRCHEWLRHTPR